NPGGVCVFGAGRWGRNHVRVLAETGRLAAVVDPDPEALAVARSLGVPVAARFDELDEPVRRRCVAAVIATPAATHYDLANQCLDRRLDILVEKPLALSLGDAQKLAERAEREERIVMTGHILLFHPAVRALRELVVGGELGDIRYVYSNRLNLGRVRREENILWSFAPHDLAAMEFILGVPPNRVRADGGSWLQPGLVDVTVTHLGFPGGIQGHVFVSWLHPGKEHRLVVVGSRKMAVFDDLRPEARLLLHDVGIDEDPAGALATRDDGQVVIALDEVEPLSAQCAHFLECIDSRQRPLTDTAHALSVLWVLEAAQRSLERQGEWIQS
ncbi:MAG: Gfo/Idh/MocA family oxidoreductase, partial [Planctomycetes bacterium]|nr:Gfo/Idh/MocA family oxidoreductase [Planctomycetota bacterium]